MKESKEGGPNLTRNSAGCAGKAVRVHESLNLVLSVPLGPIKLIRHLRPLQRDAPHRGLNQRWANISTRDERLEASAGLFS